MAFTTESGLNWWNDPLCQRRADVNEYTSSMGFKSQARTGYIPSERLRAELYSLEKVLPSNALRKSVRGVRRLGHAVFNRVSRQRRAWAAAQAIER